MKRNNHGLNSISRGALRLAALALALVLLLPAGAVRAASVDAAENVSPKLTGEVPAWAVKSSQRYTFDFANEDATYYSKHEALRIVTRTGFKVSGGRLIADGKKAVALATRGYLGDDYGIAGGSAGFKLSRNSGSVTVQLRVISGEPKKADMALRFDFKNDRLKVKDDTLNKSVELDVGKYLAGGREVSVEFIDKPTYVSLKLDGETVVTVYYTENAAAESGYSVSNYGASLRFVDGGGNELLKLENSLLQRAGSFVLSLDSFDGYVDDLFFDRTEIDQSLPETEVKRIVDYGNWVATDDLGRVTRMETSAGPVRENRTVGLFYFLCWVGAGVHVQDNTKIYLENGGDYLKKYLEERGGEAYWAEPYFGYYRNEDTWIYRRHAYMLEAAGVDFIFLDVSNREVFAAGHTALFDTWLQIRKEGGHTPQICFLNGDDPKTLQANVRNLRRTVYSDKNWEKYEELFFKWQGKPLILGNVDGVSAEIKDYLDENFTVRGCWAWCDQDGYWTWMDETWNDGKGNWVQHKGRDRAGNFEQMSVTAGHHASSSKGRSYVNGVQPNPKTNDFLFTYDESRKGLGFASQWEAAIKADPQVIMITGWNEWIAGNGRGSDYIALTHIKNVCYVDEFNPEFSRDVEPMKIRDGVGFGDNFYYQMVDYIRKYKGMAPLQIASGQKTVAAGDVDAWAEIGPEFRDHIGDTEYRNTVSYDAAFRYINGTGRNDIDYAKVSQDADKLYFLVKTVNELAVFDDSTWMNLLIDADMKHDTGWEGYDFVLNRSRGDGRLSVEKFDGNSWSSVKLGDAEYTVNGKYLTVAVDKTLLGWSSGEAANFDFKWTDNSTETGNILEFMDLGEAAPDDRFNFRYVADADHYVKLIREIEGNTVKNGGLPGPVVFAIVGATLLLVAAAAVIVINNIRKRKNASA
ncbi:MAG: hypothetical protein IJM24_05035 [Clostridia bacterium]|nr:hypothetical protein [Clostridia bacterium]